MSALSNQQETGVIAIAPSPVAPVASSSYLRPAIVDAKSGPGVIRPPPALLYRNTSREDPRMGQNTISVTPYYHSPPQVSDVKSSSGVLPQHYAQPNFFQQQTVPVPEEFQTVPIPQPYQQQTVPIPEEAYHLNQALGLEPYKRQSIPALEDSSQLHTVPIPEPYQQQTVSTPEEYDQQTVPQYEERPPQVLEQYRQNTPPLHPASSSSTLSSPTSLEKPPFIFNDDLDDNGFTPEELRNHQATIKHLHALRWVLYSRWLIRIVSVFVSLISFALIMITVVLFLKSKHSQKPQTLQDARGQYDNVDIRPSAAFASIGGIFTILSLAVNVGCCFSKKIRQITPLSNAIFATVSVVGIASWLSGCFYLHRNSAGRNLWYYVCAAAQQYNYAEAHESSSSTRILFRRDAPVDSKGLNVIAMCTYTEKAWDLGILQALFEIMTLLNVVVAVVIVRWSWFRLMTRSR